MLRPRSPASAEPWSPSAKASTNVLAPFNVNTQSIRTRFWDGHDHFFSDNVSMLKGNHLLQFGGQYQHNLNYHSRSDNGGGINFTPTYRMGEQAPKAPAAIDMSDLGGGYPAHNDLRAPGHAAVAGHRRPVAGGLHPRGPPHSQPAPHPRAPTRDVIPFYNAYVSDTWHMKPVPHPDLRHGLDAGNAAARGPGQADRSWSIRPMNRSSPRTFSHRRKAAAEQGRSLQP